MDPKNTPEHFFSVGGRWFMRIGVIFFRGRGVCDHPCKSAVNEGLANHGGGGSDCEKGDAKYVRFYSLNIIKQVWGFDLSYSWIYRGVWGRPFFCPHFAR